MEPHCIGRSALAGALVILLAGCSAGSMLSDGSAPLGAPSGTDGSAAPSVVATPAQLPLERQAGAVSGDPGTDAGKSAGTVRSGFSTTPSIRFAWSKYGASSARQSAMSRHCGSS